MKMPLTHPGPEPAGEYVAICMASTACTYQAVTEEADQARGMLGAHYVTEHHASDWNLPLRTGRQ